MVIGGGSRRPWRLMGDSGQEIVRRDVERHLGWNRILPDRLIDGVIA